MPTVGSFSFNPRGGYVATTKYAPGDIVSYNGGSYTASLITTGNLPTNTVYWTLLSSAGATGASGATGLSGAGGAMPALISGNYYAPQSKVNATPNTVYCAKDTAIYFPFSTSYSCTINWIGVGIVSISSGLAYMRSAIYNADATGNPSTRFMTDTGQNTFVNASGASFLGAGTSTVVPAGNYWAAICFGSSTSNTPNVMGFSGNDSIRARGYATAAEGSGGQSYTYLTLADATSWTSTGFPATAPAITTMSAAAGVQPAFFWKIA